MDRNPLVSLITPCYNGEKHLNRFLNSVLTQTYSNIELILINDGSSDSTEDIVLSFEKKLKRKGIRLIYVFQENKGLGGAINSGLKRVTGEYISWPDPDDYLEPESVEMRLRALENNPDFGIVTSDAYVRNGYKDELMRLISDSFSSNYDPYQFIHLLNGKSILCSGTHMVRTDAFFETHPTGEIFPSRRGQNYQMLLPVYYKYKSYFLNKPLYNYVIYDNSMSKTEDLSLDIRLDVYRSQESIIHATLSEMGLSEQERLIYSNIVSARYASTNFNLAYRNNCYNLLKEEYFRIKKLSHTTNKIRLKWAVATIKRMLFVIAQMLNHKTEDKRQPLC